MIESRQGSSAFDGPASNCLLRSQTNMKLVRAALQINLSSNSTSKLSSVGEWDRFGAKDFWEKPENKSKICRSQGREHCSMRCKTQAFATVCPAQSKSSLTWHAVRHNQQSNAAFVIVLSGILTVGKRRWYNQRAFEVCYYTTLKLQGPATSIKKEKHNTLFWKVFGWLWKEPFR